MPILRICDYGHEGATYTSLKCPVCKEQEKLIAAQLAQQDAERRLRDIEEKFSSMVLDIKRILVDR